MMFVAGGWLPDWLRDFAPAAAKQAAAQREGHQTAPYSL